ncbi:helix-turn-helix transcriptional regulator [Amycolatopsis australiensis]|uniref:Predicted DNA-binding transcriptional regulator YafY, contains an HTH and WYL domains n=1 Tax=Amycolatopsis australiensis TaxID=546364 RepID=A0A1K1SIE2_9PSEU|nr:YafY family protein [Amycolatopsis australiensis]SFW84123.1 Predicted DNA-binding transcriptional regulator YafY, contains an HTH and WYL domains [Amycolatopsis australiensis]
MLPTSARLLRLLSLLETRRDWTGADLAGRLGVTTRTVRNDVGRLRKLGYPVEASPGVQGGYRLGAGAQLPPLLLDDDEAVAVAVGLRTATGVAGIGETSVRALAKLEQVLPSRLRHRVRALQAATVAVPGTGPAVDADVLTAIAAAIRAGERLRFGYTGHDGTASHRDVEPHRLVSCSRRWYLVAWDTARDGWRTFRADRMAPKVPNGPRFTPREPPEGDVAQFVQRSVGAATWRFHAKVRLHAPVGHVRARLPPAVEVTPDGPGRCVAEVGSDHAPMLALYLGLLEVDFEVLDAPDLAEALAAIGARFLRAATGRSSPAPR